MHLFQGGHYQNVSLYSGIEIMDIDGVEVLKHYMWGYLKTVFFFKGVLACARLSDSIVGTY